MKLLCKLHTEVHDFIVDVNGFRCNRRLLHLDPYLMSRVDFLMLSHRTPYNRAIKGIQILACKETAKGSANHFCANWMLVREW